MRKYSSLSAATLHGKGNFTTLAVYDGKPFLWEKHWRRLCNDAERIGIDLTLHSEEATKYLLHEVLAENAVNNGRARITFFDETESAIWSKETKQKTSLSIIIGVLRTISKNFRLTISPYTVNSRSPLAGIKSCNYLDNLMALDQARARGFDEAIQLNERGETVTATMANVFWLKDNKLYTPSLKTGCLPGTTRELILENMDCREVEENLEELNRADEIFLTSAGLGVTQVGEFESRKFETINHPILDLLPKRL